MKLISLIKAKLYRIFLMVYVIASLSVFLFLFLIRGSSHEDLHSGGDYSVRPEGSYHECSDKLGTYKPVVLKDEHYEEKVFRRHPNLPAHLLEAKLLSKYVPHITSIRWSGTTFQESWKTSPKFLVYSAHFDTRIKGNPMIRILALFDGGRKPKDEYFCQLWSNLTEAPHITPVVKIVFIDYIQVSHKYMSPYLLSCKLVFDPVTLNFPVAVSLVKEVCRTPTNLLTLNGSPYREAVTTNQRNQDLSVGVCGKALFYYNEDFSYRLIEWIEIMKALGFSKVFLYTTAVHKNVEKVLDFYEAKGFVKLINFQYPTPYVAEKSFIRLWSKTEKNSYRAAQKMYINDCLMRNKDDFDYLLVSDVDEVPVFMEHATVNQFLQDVIKKYPISSSRPSLKLSWKLFFENLSPGKSLSDVPESFYILRHNRRTSLDSPRIPVFETNYKTIYDTQQILAALIHTPKLHLIEPAYPVQVNPYDAYMAHFANRQCPLGCNEDPKYEEETFLSIYKDKIIEKVNATVWNLHLNKGYFCNTK